MLSKCSLLISDGGNSDCVNKEEVINELTNAYNSFQVGALSDYALYLKGKKDALLEVIEYLERL